MLTSSRVTGERVYEDPELTPLRGGSTCTYGAASPLIFLFSGPKSEERWDDFLSEFAKDDETKHPVPAVGKGAYVIYPKPENEVKVYGVLAVKAGPHTLGIFLRPGRGEPVESVQPKLVETGQESDAEAALSRRSARVLRDLLHGRSRRASKRRRARFFVVCVGGGDLAGKLRPLTSSGIGNRNERAPVVGRCGSRAASAGPASCLGGSRCCPQPIEPPSARVPCYASPP